MMDAMHHEEAEAYARLGRSLMAWAAGLGEECTMMDTDDHITLCEAYRFRCTCCDTVVDLPFGTTIMTFAEAYEAFRQAHHTCPPEVSHGDGETGRLRPRGEEPNG